MLTAEQLQTLKAYINSVPAWAALPNNEDNAFFIAAELSKVAAPAFSLWRTEAPTSAIFDAIDWPKYTPSDAADGTAIYTNRLLLIQTKQMNLQTMCQGRETVNANKASVRSGLRDATIGIPAGTAGANTTPGGAGGVNVLNALTRPALLIEKVLAGAQATTGTVTANLIGYEGGIGYQDVVAARSA